MHLFFSLCALFIFQIYASSNFNPDYPTIKYCTIPDDHPHVYNSYKYLKRQLSLDQGCTHIRGSVFIDGIYRNENGTDPDLSFLESIVEISGKLRIMGNSVRRIPLGNLRIIRGSSSPDMAYALEISHNIKNGTHVEEIDLHSLRVILEKNVRINDNRGLGYLEQRVNWQETLASSSSQQVTIQPSLSSNKNESYQCHTSCEYWKINATYSSQYCFGPLERDCQPRTKCAETADSTWCYLSEGKEIPCDSQCIGGCTGRHPRSCVACSGLFKKDRCVSSCSPQTSGEFGKSGQKLPDDKLIFTTGGLCTSQCPYSLLDQEKHCIYECDFNKYYKSGNRCIECPNQRCFTPIADKLMCDLKRLDPTNPNNGRRHVINKETLLKLKNCTVLVGEIILDDFSFEKFGVTTKMLYDNLRNVEEVIGDLIIMLFRTDVKNLSFFANLREVRGTVASGTIQHGLKIFVSSLEFLGLKRLEKVYGVVNFRHDSNLCYDNTIPWKEITHDEFSDNKCNKTCDPLCTNGCWGPGNKFCYKCEFLEAGESCVRSCSDAVGYYAHKPPLTNGTVKKTQCQKCHPLCKDNCTGSNASDCTACRFAKENGQCVASCSSAFYPVPSTSGGYTNCKPCHDTCYRGEMLKNLNLSVACTGPSNIIGSGGCTMCNKIIRDNTTRCHLDLCPRGYFETTIKAQISCLVVQKIACEMCHPLCGECLDGGTSANSCKSCRGFWSNGHCVSTCLNIVKNVSRPIKPGANCPKCHPECAGGCYTEDDNSSCDHCRNKKLFIGENLKKFTCVAQCPVERNNTEHIGGDFVCLTLDQTRLVVQRKIITIVIATSVISLLVVVLLIIILYRYKFRQSKIKAELKAFYSNFDEPIMKNLKDDHVTRPPNMSRLQMIQISDLVFDINSKPLGAGAFGKVFRGTWKVPGPGGKFYYLDVVVKVIHNSSKSSTNEFLEEAQIMASVSHRHCLPLIGVCLSLEKPCLVSTFAKYGSLEKYLHQYGSKISSYSLLKWCEQIADGMAYLNMRGIIHRDLAARNILVNDKDFVQITDFGLARLVDDTEDGIVVQSGRVPIRWLALETLLYANYTTASDIWAYGVTLWEIFTYGKRPYEEIETSKVKSYLQEGNRLYQPDICTLEVYMVMIKCWLEDPQQRPSFNELMAIFDHFSRNAKRYLCIEREHLSEYSSSVSRPKDSILLTQFSTESDIKVQPNFTNRSDDMSWNQGFQSDSAYHLINHSFNKDNTENHTVLPRRKKTKRSISFNKLKSFPKIGLTKLLANKSHDSKTCQYFPSSSCDSNKTSYLSCESTSALLSHRKSSEYEGPPLNPQIVKLIKQESQLPGRILKPMSKQDSLYQHERIFNDRPTSETEAAHIPQRSRSPSLPPIEIFRFISVEPLIPNQLPEISEKVSEHSPDSGNSHEFDADEYLAPSRVQSQGYYNLTPSPSSIMKPTMDLDESNMVENDNDETKEDDGYMEPTAKTSC